MRVGFAESLGKIGEQPRTGKKGHALCGRDLAGGVFQAEGAEVVGPGADEGDAVGREGLGEGGVLGEEAVAGMNRLGPRLAAGREDGVDVQITFGGRGGAEADGAGGLHRGGGEAVGVGPDRDGADAHPGERPKYPDGDFAPVGDQDAGEHEARDVPERADVARV